MKKEINELMSDLEAGLWDLLYHEDLPEGDRDIARDAILALRALSISES